MMALIIFLSIITLVIINKPHQFTTQKAEVVSIHSLILAFIFSFVYLAEIDQKLIQVQIENCAKYSLLV